MYCNSFQFIASAAFSLKLLDVIFEKVPIFAPLILFMTPTL